MNKKDFPAAHSMDSAWYAVDELGHVAVFSTGEAGCMPASIEYNEDAETLLDVLNGVDPSQIEFYADDICTEADEKAFQYSWRSMKLEPVELSSVEHVYSGILWLKDDSVFNADKHGDLPEVLFGKNPKSYSRLTHLPNHKFVLAHASGITKAGLENMVRNRLVNRIWIGLDVSSSRLGFYTYDHSDSFENWIAGPFVKDGEPVQPVKFESLPDGIQKIVGTLRFSGVNFQVDHAVDAYAHDKCHSWGSRFVTLSGLVLEQEDDDNG